MSASDLSIRAGSTYYNEGGQVFQVKKIHQHPNFDNNTYDFDVSILELENPLQFGPRVRSVSLATSGTNINSGLDGYASGWGQTDPHIRRASDHLQSVVLPTISLDDCKIFYNSKLTERMFCAGFAEGGKDTCQVIFLINHHVTNSLVSDKGYFGIFPILLQVITEVVLTKAFYSSFRDNPCFSKSSVFVTSIKNIIFFNLKNFKLLSLV